MNEIYIKTNTHNVFDLLDINDEKDLISIKDLLDMLEEQYYEIQRLMEKIEDFEKEPDDGYDAWKEFNNC